MKALEIYEQDLIDREQGEPLPRQQYYTALRDALHRELMQQGFSDFLEQTLLEIRGGDREKIYVADYAVLMECHSMIVLGREMRDASEFVPHLHLRGEKARWEALERPGTFLMPITRDMTEKFKQLRAVSRQLVDARDDTVIPQADDAAQREIEQVHTLNKLLDERCRALQAERDELQQRLRLLEEGVITEQVRYAIEARRLQEEEVLRQSYEAQRDAARAAYRTQLAQELADGQAREEAARQETAAIRAQAAQDYAAVRQEMARDLQQLTALLEGKLSAWQRGLDRSECRLLALSYASLHDLWAQTLPQLILDAQCAGADPALMDGLTQLRSQLSDRLNQLEQALLRLGLIVLRPAAGEPFDSAKHLPAGALPGQGTQALIARCLRPGVAAADSPAALLKAEVALQDR